MALLKEYRSSNLPSTYVVMPQESVIEVTVPFNLLHILGAITLTRESLPVSGLPFSNGGRMRIMDYVVKEGYCFYKWPGRILGPSLGDVLEVEQEKSKVS